MQYKTTIGADFLTKELDLNGTIVQLQLWDTAGQEKFHSMGSSFYRSSECCVLVFDLTEVKSFEIIDSWRTEFLTKLNPKDPETFPFVLLGNKSDLTEERKINNEDIKKYCEKNKGMPYFETSAKDNIGVEKAFKEIANLAFKRNSNNDDLILPQTPMNLNLKVEGNTKKKCCNQS